MIYRINGSSGVHRKPPSGSASGAFDGARLSFGASQSLANGVWTDLTLDTALFDSGGYHDFALSPDKILLPAVGFYELTLNSQIEYATNLVLNTDGEVTVLMNFSPGGGVTGSPIDFEYKTDAPVGESTVAAIAELFEATNTTGWVKATARAALGSGPGFVNVGATVVTVRYLGT